MDEHGSEQNETREDIKKAIIQLGIENGLASQYTSFVGIDDKTGDTLSDAPMWTREIRNQIPTTFNPNISLQMPSSLGLSLLSRASVPRIDACSSKVRRHCGSTGVDNVSNFKFRVSSRIRKK